MRPEMNVPQESSLVGVPEGRAALELEGASDVVEESGGDQKIDAQPRVQLGRLPAKRRHADCVLEQPACVGVVRVGRSWELAQPLPDGGVGEKPAHRLLEPGVRNLLREEVEKAVELIRISSESWRQGGRIELGGRLE